jgi:hypothetical protein
MSEVLSMKAAKPARPAKTKNGENVWRCGWGTYEGTGCQEAFGVVEIFRSLVEDVSLGLGEISYRRIRLTDGYEKRPETHTEAGTYFHTNRPGKRTNRTKGIIERGRKIIKKNQETRRQMIEAAYKRKDALPDNIKNAYMDHSETKEQWRAKRPMIDERIKVEIECERAFHFTTASARLAAQRNCEAKAMRERWAHYLIDRPSKWPNGLPAAFEEFLPIVIRCKTCKRLSKIQHTGIYP